MMHNLEIVIIITTLHAMQTRSGDENSVSPSVRLSNGVHCDKTEERSVQIFLYHTKDHLA